MEDDLPEPLLNAICPYFTMFPLQFPLAILARAKASDRVLDPYCGRGTTSFAARLLGLESLAVDSSPVATAITASKLVSVSPGDVVQAAANILRSDISAALPEGEFWKWAYHQETLKELVRLRAALLTDCTHPELLALRGIILGALHGPKPKTRASYFSNQSPRTYAPKPAYAVKFWKAAGLQPDFVDVMEVISRRAERYYANQIAPVGEVRLGDSRNEALFRQTTETKFKWVVTSPPYYGMRTYIPDQWLRGWFVGGTDTVNYGTANQLRHSGPEVFASELALVWKNVRKVCADGARLVIRFGGISDRAASPVEIIKGSLRATGWQADTIKPAGLATDGRRQADSFLRRRSTPVAEVVVWATAI